jgi:hypothetical protein
MRGRNYALVIGAGVVIGVIAGTITGNIAMWIGIGIAIAIAGAAAMGLWRQPRDGGGPPEA